MLCAPEASDAMGMSLSVANTPADMDAAVASSSAERMVLRFTLCLLAIKVGGSVLQSILGDEGPLLH
jgi:hypothetical protein